MSQTMISDALVASAEEFIEHHGVKGMRWGVRKDRGSVKAARSKSKSKSDDAGTSSSGSTSTSRATSHRTAKSYKSNEVTKLSDRELKAAIERIQNEKKYHKLTYKPSTKERLAAFAKETLTNAAKSSVQSYVNQASAVMLSDLLGDPKIAKKSAKTEKIAAKAEKKKARLDKLEKAQDKAVKKLNKIRPDMSKYDVRSGNSDYKFFGDRKGSSQYRVVRRNEEKIAKTRRQSAALSRAVDKHQLKTGNYISKQSGLSKKTSIRYKARSTDDIMNLISTATLTPSKQIRWG